MRLLEPQREADVTVTLTNALVGFGHLVGGEPHVAFGFHARRVGHGRQGEMTSSHAVDPAPRLKLTSMADVVAVPVAWLWNGRLPLGKLAVVAGDPGLGKSYLTLLMAAIVSRGDEWPDGERATTGNVIIVSAEDDAADTIRPRLDRLGADVARITMIDGVLGDGAAYARPFSLRMHVDLLREAIIATHAVMVIIDPLNAFLGSIDSHKAAEVRGVLSPLAHIAAETHAALVAVHHLNKGTSPNALYRASGSLDFVAAARIVHGVAPDPDIEGRRLLVPVKCNIAAMPAGIGFSINDEGVTFDDLPVVLDAATAFTTRNIDHEERSERQMAREFLCGELAAGPVAAVTLLKTAGGYGYSRATVRRAASDLKVDKVKDGYQGQWLWSLPGGPDEPESGKGGRLQGVSAFDTFAESGLECDQSLSTFAATPEGPEGRPSSHPLRADDGKGVKDAQALDAPSLETSKDDQEKRRDAFAGGGPIEGAPVRGEAESDLDEHLHAGIETGEDRAESEVPVVSSELFKSAAAVVVKNGAASQSLIVRRCACDRAMAGQVMAALEAEAVVGPPNGGVARDVLIAESDLPRVVAAYSPLPKGLRT